MWHLRVVTLRPLVLKYTRSSILMLLGIRPLGTTEVPLRSNPLSIVPSSSATIGPTRRVHRDGRQTCIKLETPFCTADEA
jgi:hypothetical protein